MRKIVVFLTFFVCGHFVHAQSQEAEQLALNWEKLVQFKKILHDMYEGWKIADKGYQSIKNISRGSFTLHKDFLDALMDVSPAVKKYRRIASIIQYQTMIIQQYKTASRKFRSDDMFTKNEIDHIIAVYHYLFEESIKSLEELGMVITAGHLRMSDDERISTIDRIYAKVTDEYNFLQDFTASTAYLSLQRKSEKTEIDMLRRLYGQ